MEIGSSIAFVIYCGILVGGFIFATFIPAAPYITLATFLSAGFAAYLGKRLIQKGEKYNNERTEKATDETCGVD